MNFKNFSYLLTLTLLCGLSQDLCADDLQSQLNTLQNQLDETQKDLLQTKKDLKQTQEEFARKHENEKISNTDTKKDDSYLKIGGAVRMNYSYTNYQSNLDNSDRGGDFDFDLFRLDIDGKSNDILVSAQIRFFHYMYAIRHAWFGYDINPYNQVQVGIVPLPFGNMPYNSNNYFFSANYYLGLEDTQVAGIHWQHKGNNLDFDLGFYKNDDVGGIDGYVSNRNDSYTYNIVGTDLNTSTNEPQNELAENNTFASRIATKVFDTNDVNVEVGISGLYGEIVDASSNVGDRYAYALHSIININKINIKLQATKYKIDLDSQEKIIAVGAYSYNNQIASSTDSYTADIAYNQDVQLGPIQSLLFYNDYSHLTNKSDNLEDTIMNVTGVAISAGKLYTYVDYVVAKNMPFIGGDMAGNTNDWNTRFNINIGYYF